MRLSVVVGAILVVAVSALGACGSTSNGDPYGQAGSSSGSAGAAAGSAGAAAGVSGSQAGSASGGTSAGSGGVMAGAGGIGAGAGGASGGGGTNEGGVSGLGGQANEAGAPGAGGAGSDPCGGCDAPDEVCVYQTGGPPGLSRYRCAAQLPCAAPGACACIVDQGECGGQLMGDPPSYCVCDNGLD